MSQYLAISNRDYQLSYAALEVACHAVEKHCDKLKTNNYNDLLVCIVITHFTNIALEFT